MRALALAVLFLGSIAGLASGCGGAASVYDGGGTPPPGCTAATATATTSVSLSGTQFVPSCVKVSPGATVTFTNADPMNHTVTTDPSQPETFDSGLVAPGQAYSHKFASVAETVHVHCSIHPAMTATVFVQ